MTAYFKAWAVLAAVAVCTITRDRAVSSPKVAPDQATSSRVNANPARSPANPKVLHVLNRLSFGPRPGDIERVTAMGVERYIHAQLNPATIPEPLALTEQLAQLSAAQSWPAGRSEAANQTLSAAMATPKLTNKLTNKLTAAERKMARQQSRTRIQQAMQARLLRATQSDRQLEEVMVDFWFNHFNVFANKGLTRQWIASYEETAIRPHALGRFRELLEATARHPAMLIYLDNWQNTAPNSPGARRRFQGLNENYARELMELHTLGVNGGYTQNDVTALATILTGWGVRQRPSAAGGEAGFYFDAKRHDFSDKKLLGHLIRGQGEAEVEQALDLLAKNPATARHISYKLAQYFVADAPPPALVDRLAQRYLSSDGDICAVLTTLFESAEFWHPGVYGTKFKTPYQYVVSALRATDLPLERSPQPITNLLQQLGMPLYGCPTPDGYQNTKAAWLNPDSMTRRLSFATRLGEQSSQPLAQLSHTLGNRLSAQTQQAIATSPTVLQSALILGSPEFMHR
jgi:uncharacterized protein (DUF1800 family)